MGLLFTVQSVNLLYQFWIHTERIGKLWAPVEFVLNTPPHRRVHHGSNPQYLDKNYGGILIIWDRLFGTFEPEVEPVIYGLTTNIDTYNLLRVAFHEYAAIGRDLRAARSLRHRIGIVFRDPGWFAHVTAASGAAATLGAAPGAAAAPTATV